MSRDLLIAAAILGGGYLLTRSVSSAAGDAARAAGDALVRGADWLLGPPQAQPDAPWYDPVTGTPRAASQTEVDAKVDENLARLGKTRADLDDPALKEALRKALSPGNS